MDVRTLVEQVRDALTVKRVYSDPVERDGITVITAARVRGGGGGGEGPAGKPGEADPSGVSGESTGTGSGGGFGLDAKPVGAYVIRNGKVSWQPAVDVNRVILGAQVTAVVAMLVIRQILRGRLDARQPLGARDRRTPR